VVRGEQGRDWLADQLSAAGATLRTVAAYARQAPVLSPAGLQLLAAAHADPARHLWLFSSSEAIRHLAAQWPGGVPAGARAVATHPRIADSARRAGFAEVRLAPPAPAAVLQAIRGASIQSSAP
jgi:uroporphyrinogen-III synthase